MAKLRGVNGEVWNGSVKITGVSDYTINAKMATADASDHDSGGWGETMTTTASWNVKVTGLYIDGDAAQQAIRDAMAAGTTVSLKFRPNGTGTGKTEFSGQARITDYTVGAPQNGVQPLDWSADNVGAPTWGTQA